MGPPKSVPPLRARPGYHLHPGAHGLRARVATNGTPVTFRRLSLRDGEIGFAVGLTPPFDRGAVFALQVDADTLDRPLVLRARCRTLRPVEDQGVRVVFEHSPSPDEARRIDALLESLRESNQAHSDWRTGAPLEEIVGPRERIAALLEAMVLLHRELRVHSSDGAQIPSSDLQEKARWPSGSFTVDVRAPRADYVFHVGALPADGSPREMRLLRTAMRSESRVAAPPRVTLAFEHRVLRERVSLKVEAVSRRTLVVTRRPGLPLCPGMELPGAELRWKGGRLELDLVVGDSVRDPVHGRCQELRVRPRSRDLLAWHDQVDRVCHPHAGPLRNGAGELWELYASSGYLNISDKRPELFAHLESSFERAARALAEHPELGAQVTWQSMDGLDGSVTFLTAWERSSLIYQLARASQRPLWMSGSRPLYDLYLRATEHVIRHGVEWLVVFVQHAGARFSKRVNRDFPLRFADGERSHVSAFRAWEIPTLVGDPPEHLRRVSCEEPTAQELRDWLSDLASRRDPAYLAGYDLIPERALLREPTSRFGQAGLSRRRALRVAKIDGEPVAMAWIEHVSDGVHLFGLLDSIRIDRFAPLDPASEALVRRALVREAQLHLGALGKRIFMFFDEAMGTAPVPGAVNLGDADQALFSTDLCTDLVEEVAIAVGGVNR